MRESSDVFFEISIDLRYFGVERLTFVTQRQHETYTKIMQYTYVY